MPPAIIAAGIGAAGVLGGTALSTRASNRATQAGLTANQEALAYQRERDAEERAMAEQQWAAYNAGRTALLRRYGINVDLTGGAPAGPPAAVPRGVVGRGGPGPIPGRGTIGDLARPPVGAVPPLMEGSGPQSWRDWSRLGLGSRGRA